VKVVVWSWIHIYITGQLPKCFTRTRMEGHDESQTVCQASAVCCFLDVI